MSFTFQNPFVYVNNPANSNPVGLGKMYIGLPDTDPVDLLNPANQIPVYAVQPDGSELQIPQPVRTTAGGVVTYGGTPIQLKVSEEIYSVRIDSSANAQLYYTARVELSGGVPDGVVLSINSIKSLEDVTEPAVNTVYEVIGYYEDTTVGGGGFVWEATRPYSDHNGGTVIAPPAIAAWDGTQADIATILNWTPTGGVGCWVRVGVITLTPEMFGAPKNGTNDDGPSIVAAQKANYSKSVDVTGSYYIKAQTSNLTTLKLHGLNAVINGYNGTGFLVSGEISLSGSIEFTGFENAASREDQKTNYTTCAIRIQTGSNVSYVRVGKDVHFNKCRNGIRACSNSDDFTPDTTITVSGKSYFYASSSQTISAIKLRCVYSDIELARGLHQNCIGAGRVVVPLDVYIDGIANASPFYDDCTNIHAHHLIFKNVINRTTTGTSSGSNNYECNAMKLAARNIQVDHIIGEDVTGVNFDCELIYTKARNVTIDNIVAINCGAQEGCINVKGVEENNTTATSPFGGKVCIDNVFILFNRYSYNNNGTTVNLNCTGINLESPYDIALGDNIQVVGANAGDLVINCGLTDGAGNVSSNTGVVGKIISRQNVGGFSVRVRGQAKYARLVVDCADANPTGEFRAVILQNLASRGANGDFDISGSSLKISSETTEDITLLYIDGQNQVIRNIRADNCTWDVVAPNSNQRAIRSSAQAAGPTGYVEKLSAKGWTFVNSDFESPISIGSYPVNSYDLDFDYDSITTSNVNVTAGSYYVPTGKSIKLQANLTAFRTDNRSQAYSSKQTALFYEASGAPVQIGSTLQTEFTANTTDVGMFYGTDDQSVTVRLNGNTGEQYLWNVKIQVIAK